MKEIPILFSTPMVQAELDGRKTMTRRTTGLDTLNEDPNDWQFEWAEPPRNLWTFTQRSSLNEESLRDRTFNQFQTKCPYGKPGDILWVRETWAPYLRGTDDNGFVELIKYKADGAEIAFKHVKDYAELGWHNRPGIHMNKEYSRIWMQVESIRVERLQDITEEDAKAEGVTVTPEQAEANITHRHVLKDRIPAGDHQPAFCNLWREIHFTSIQDQLSGKDGWNENPWVWVVTFKVLSTTGKPDLNTLKAIA